MNLANCLRKEQEKREEEGMKRGRAGSMLSINPY
jgi:hypothetical protein